MLVFFTLIFLMRIVYTYEVVQHALNQSAKELSSYSYFYAVSGAADINGTIIGSTSGGIDKFNTGVGNVVDAYSSIVKLGGDIGNTASAAANGDIQDMLSGIDATGRSYSDLQSAYPAAADTIKSVITDPVSAIKSVGSVLISGTNENVKTFLGGELTRALMSKYIKGKLEDLQVVGGLSGLDFSASKFWSPEQTSDIELTVCYTIKPILPIKVFNEINLVNRVRVRGWSGKSIF